MKKGFWKSIIESFGVFKYKELSKAEFGESFSYFITFFSIMSVVALLIAIPFLIKMPGMVKTELEKADEFTVNVTVESEQPLYFPSERPLFSIVNNDTESKGLLSFTKKKLIYNFFPGIQPSVNIESYSNVKENSEDAANLALVLIFLIAPSIIIYTYLFNLVKYILIALILSMITKVVMSAMRKKIKYKKLWSATMYSLTPLILIEMVMLPFNIPLFFIPLILYIIWYILISLELVEEF
ncbi:DUF1189 family protein [Candidatus Woesearchaeota archaeon]|nr:DUF1189 family protein [Candidatus Woesearchaeota archaeon]